MLFGAQAVSAHRTSFLQGKMAVSNERIGLGLMNSQQNVPTMPPFTKKAEKKGFNAISFRYSLAQYPSFHEPGSG
jgi:hypothetical protein